MNYEHVRFLRLNISFFFFFVNFHFLLEMYVAYYRTNCKACERVYGCCLSSWYIHWRVITAKPDGIIALTVEHCCQNVWKRIWSQTTDPNLWQLPLFLWIFLLISFMLHSHWTLWVLDVSWLCLCFVTFIGFYLMAFYWNPWLLLWNVYVDIGIKSVI